MKILVYWKYYVILLTVKSKNTIDYGQFLVVFAKAACSVLMLLFIKFNQIFT